MQSHYNCYIEAISIIAETVAAEIEIKLGGREQTRFVPSQADRYARGSDGRTQESS
jgi:hypothetical protein